MKGILLVLLSLNVYASSFESGLAFTCVNQAKYIGIESNKGTMDYCKPCTSELFERQGKRFSEVEIQKLCNDAVLLYIEQQNKNLPKQ